MELKELSNDFDELDSSNSSLWFESFLPLWLENSCSFIQILGWRSKEFDLVLSFVLSQSWELRLGKWQDEARLRGNILLSLMSNRYRGLHLATR